VDSRARCPNGMRRRRLACSRTVAGYSSRVAQGETRGERRKRRRRQRTSSPPYPDHSTLPRPPSDEEALLVALEERPGWVKAVWATPGRRLALSIAWIAGALWVLFLALTDPQEWFGHRASIPGFVAAPLLLVMFGLQAAEAARDVALGRDSVPVFHRLGWWLDRRGIVLIVGYVLVMVAASIVLIG
jgi:hypothetical protein